MVGGPGQQAVGTVSGVVTDTNGNFLSGVQVTAAVAGKALRGKDATSLTVTTGANGHFVIPNVPVVNVVNNNGSEIAGGALTISVVAPTGYFGATAQVFPQAQVTSSEGVGGQTNPAVLWFDHFNADAGTLKLPKTDATITGTLRDSGTGTPLAAKALRLTFEQVSRDQYGETSCTAPEGSSPSDCPSPLTSVIVTYATGSTQTATSDANGVFTFAGVPEDSCLRLYAPGYNLTSDGGDFGGALCDDEDEANSVNWLGLSTHDDFVQLNQVFASASPNADTIAPYVVAVDNASFVTGPCGTLSSVVGDTVVIHFSEPVNVTGAVDGNNPITVLIGAFPNFTFDTVDSATLSQDKTTLTLVLADPLPDTADVTIDIPVEDVTDLAGNPLTAIDGGVDFDSIISTSNGQCPGDGCSIENVVDQLCFNTFAPGTQPTGALTVTQVNPAQNADGGPDVAALNLLFDSTSSLIDIVANGDPNFAVDGNGDDICFGTQSGPCTDTIGKDPDQIDQFNSFQDNPRTGTQLDNLAEALNGNTFINVTTHVARVHMNVPTGTVNFAVALIDPVSGLPKDALFFPVRTATGGGNPTALGEVADGKAITTINNGGVMWYSIAPNGATDLDVIIAEDFVGNPDKPNPGDIFVAIARGQTSGGAFVLGPAAQVTLQDLVGPTVALQLLGCNPSGPDDCATQGSAIFGQGGVVVNQQNSATGTVVLNVTPQAGDTSEAHTADNGTTNGYYADDFKDELWRTSAAFANGAADPGRTDSVGQNRALTDATGTDAYLTGAGAANARVAIDLVERVTTGPGALPASPTGGSSALSNYVAVPSVRAENATGVCNPCNDEVQFSVSRIVGEDALGGARAATFQNDAIDNDVIDLTGGITDLNGNTATDANNARVVMQDKFPPLVVEAFTDGLNTYIRWNEPILKEGSITFIGATGGGGGACFPATVDLSQDNVVLSADGLVLQIPGTGVNSVFNPVTAGCFSPTTGAGSEFTYAEPIYTIGLVTAIAADAGVVIAPGTLPTTLRHAEIGYRNVPDAQGNIWDCARAGPGRAFDSPGAYFPQDGSTAFCNSNGGLGTAADATFVWAGTQLGMAGPTFELANILGPFTLNFTATDFVEGNSAATFVVQGTHPIDNWFTERLDHAPNTVAEIFTDLDGASTNGNVGNCSQATDNSVTCDASFIAEWATLNGTSTCAVGTGGVFTSEFAGTSTVTLSADQTTLTLHIVCQTGTFLQGDQFVLADNGGGPAATGFVDNVPTANPETGTGNGYASGAPNNFDTARSAITFELSSPVAHTFTASGP